MNEKLKIRFLTLWQGLQPREQFLLKIMSTVLGLIIVFFALVQPVIISTFQKRSELRKINQQLFEAQNKIKLMDLEVQQTVNLLHELTQYKEKVGQASAHFLEQIGNLQTELGFKILVLSMPSGAETDPIPPEVAQLMVEKATNLSPKQEIPYSPPRIRGASYSRGVAPSAQDPKQESFPTRERYGHIQMELRAQASYIQLGKLLTRLDTLPHWIRITHMNIQKASGGGAPSVTLSLRIVSQATRKLSSRSSE